MALPTIYPDLAGRVAVVTGGSRGIGAATAGFLAANGMAVAVVGRDEGALSSVAARIQESGGRAIGVRADVTVEDDVVGLRDAVLSELGAPHLVACFAGGAGRPVPASEETAAHWRIVLDSELVSTFLTVTAFLPAMLERGHGVILTIASAAARQPARSSASYAAAKAGVIAYTRQLAAELGPRGIRVNCLSPSAVENDKMRAGMTPEQRQALGASFPLGRIGQPADVAAAALFLASASASWITGVVLDVAGGKIMV